MDQIERIKKMEKILNESTEIVKDLRDALDRYVENADKMKELFDYYELGEWQNDYNDDAEGKIPEDLPRGVLTEDLVYNLMIDNDCILEDIRMV